MSTQEGTTLRLIIPQWQGGNVHAYYFGSQLLAWLAPVAKGPVEIVPAPEPKTGETLEVENGILGRAALLRQARTYCLTDQMHQWTRWQMFHEGG